MIATHRTIRSVATLVVAAAWACLWARPSLAAADDPPVPIPVAPPPGTAPVPVPDPAPVPVPVPPAAPAPTPAPDAPPTPTAPTPPPPPSTPPPEAPAAPAAGGAPAPAGEVAPKADDAAKPAEAPKDAPKPDEPKKDEAKPAEPKKDDKPAEPTPEAKAATVAAVPPMLPVCAPIPSSCCFWHGVATARLRARTTTDGDHDVDLYEYLRLRYRAETDTGWSGALYGRVAQDLDGFAPRGQYDPFNDVDSSYGTVLTGRLYHLYATYRFDCGPLEQVRIGRQDVDGGYPFLVDGVHVTTAPRGEAEFQATGFVGMPAHLFEDSPEGDFIGGLGVAFRPWTDADARADWVYVVDENAYYGTPRNNLFTGELRQKLSSWASGRVWYEQVDSHAREVGVSGLSYLPEHDLALRGSFKSQLYTENSLVYDFDSYTAILRTLHPYWDAHVSASKGLSACVSAEAGITGRGLWDSGDVGTFNREFVRGYATLSREFARNNVTLSFTGEYWASDENVVSGGFDLTWKPSACFKLSSGIDYALYRTDFINVERYHSYGLYGRAWFVPAASWKADITLRAEDDTRGTFLTLMAGLAYEF